MDIKGSNFYLSEGMTEIGYAGFLKWFTDIEVMKYIGFAKRTLRFKTLDEIKSFVSELDDGIFFEMYAKDNNLIGYTVLSHFKEKECELGIIIGEKDYWDKGIGQEASKLTVDYAFEKLGIERVVLSTSGLHEPAVRCYEGCGFRTYKLEDARDVFHDGNG